MHEATSARSRVMAGVVAGTLLLAGPADSFGAGGSPTTLREADQTHPFAPLVASSTPGLLKAFQVPGAAVGLIRNGAVVWMRGFGLADVASGSHVTPDTRFNVGSISKTVTAWGIFRLVERGKVDLDRPVDTYLRRWHLPPSSFGSDEVTVRRLLSHTAGVSTHDYHGWSPDPPLPGIDASLSGKTGTGEVRLVAAPGVAFSYSGAGYSILQLLIEDVSGRSFEEFMTAEVLAPLQMSATEYGWPRASAAGAAVPYGVLGEPLPRLRYNELAAAGLTTTLRDLAVFAAAGLANGREVTGRGVLRPQTIALMQSPVASQSAGRDLYGPAPAYGLGYTVRPEQFAGQIGVGHGGSNRGWESFFQVVPSTGDGIVILTNGSSGQAVVSSLLCRWRQWAAAPGAVVDCPKLDVRAVLYGVYQAGGAREAVARYLEIRRQEADQFDFAPHQLNSMGYELLRRGDLEGALEVFRLNAEQFPNDWNVHDSLGEAYWKLGDKARAALSYKRSLALNPASPSGRDALATLGAFVK